MKVKIANYRSYNAFGTVDEFMEKLGLDWCPGAWLYSKLGKRKVKVKIDPWDIYEGVSSMSYVILPLVKGMRADLFSIHAVDKADVPEVLHKTYDEHGFSLEAWDWVLGEMEFAFEYITEDWIPEDGEEWKRLEERCTNGTVLFGKYFRGFWT